MVHIFSFSAWKQVTASMMVFFNKDDQLLGVGSEDTVVFFNCRMIKYLVQAVKMLLCSVMWNSSFATSKIEEKDNSMQLSLRILKSYYI